MKVHSSTSKTKSIRSSPFSINFFKHENFILENNLLTPITIQEKRNRYSRTLGNVPQALNLNNSTSKSLSSSKKYPDIFFNTCFDKNNLKTLIAWFLDNYGQNLTVELVENLKQVGFHQATQAGVSLGVDDLKIPPQKPKLLLQASSKMENVTREIQIGNLTSVEKSQRLIDTWNQTSETLRQTAVQNFRITNPVNPVYMMAFSGARGNISQVRQLVAMRGLMADPQGAILEFPIQSNFREGLTITEYLISCYGARKGLVDTALRTATSGYLTRRLVDAVQHVVVNATDCQTQKGIVLKDKNLEQRLIGRVLLKDLSLNSSINVLKNTIISAQVAKQIASKCDQVLVRSPLTCQTEKSVCQLCYGLDLAQGKLVSIGEAVGIIAAQSIGEPGTQLTMRTFHTGGVGVFSDQALKSFTAPFEGKIEFCEFFPGLFVRTPHGNIVYLLKHKTITDKKPILRLIPCAGGNKIYEIPQIEVPAGSLVWVKQGEIVKSGQLLIQASRLQTATQEMPESSHPVKSPLSGEIFFQSMAIRIIEEEKRALQKTKKKKQQNLVPVPINQKEISPTFPTLVELGNFWVFSSFIQKEFGFGDRFFKKGDLISTDTPIQQYDLYVQSKGQLQLINSLPSIGENKIDFSLSKIDYKNSVYFLQFSDCFKNKTILSYTSNSKQSILTWYPFLKKFSRFSSGLFTVFEPVTSSGKVSEYQENFKIANNGKSEFLKLNYFLNFYQIFSLKTHLSNPKVENIFHNFEYVLNLENETLSQNGFFQIQKKPTSNLSFWCPKVPFLEELSQNSEFSKCFEDQKFTRSFLPNPLQKRLDKTKKTNFLSTGLKKAEQLIFSNSDIQLIKQKEIWLSIPNRKLINEINSQNAKSILEAGKKLDNISFSNFPVSINFVNSKNLTILGKKEQVTQPFSFYSMVVMVENDFQISFKTTQNELQKPGISKTSFLCPKTKSFCFYKREVQSKFKFSLKVKKPYLSLLCFQKTYEQILPDTKNLKQEWLEKQNENFKSLTSVKSPLFTKQLKTKINFYQNTRSIFRVVIPSQSGWISHSQLLKVQIRIDSPKMEKKIEHFHKKIILKDLRHQVFTNTTTNFINAKVPLSGLNLFVYKNFTLTNPTKFSFQTFSDAWILPEYSVSSAFLRAAKLGEFRGFQKKKNKTFLSILRNQDLSIIKLRELYSTLNSPNLMSNKVKIGRQVRWGEEIISGFGVSTSGKLLKITENHLVLRNGIPLLASVRGLVHISHNDFVLKDDLLITLRSRRLQTEDIVQGIPKIEQLFEARETQGGEIIQNNMHTLLNTFFNRAKQVKPITEAVELSLSYIQKFLVENILEAYSTQGVQIAEKHVEVVVRQMTARVRITQGGDSGLLPGEFIQIRLIETINQKLSQLGRRPAHYEPVILGITKSVLQSESFLLAASFQQVSKVLVRSALSRKTDFLRGLHENILVGQAIPAGTGMIKSNRYLES